MTLRPFIATAEDAALGIAGMAERGDFVVAEKKHKPRGNPEFVLQCSAVKQLRALLPLDYIVASHCAERASMSEGSKSRMQGQLKGWPDTEVCGDGKTWRIEWKAERGHLSVDQKYIHRRLREACQMVCVCYSVEGAVKFLHNNGARFRGKIAA